MTEYVLTLQGDAASRRRPDTTADRLTGYRAHAVFAQACADAGHTIHDDAELHHTRALVVRVEGGRVAIADVPLADGPFAEGTEVIAGFYRISTDDVDGLALLVADLLRVTGEVAVLREVLEEPVGV
ncbi:hypothetical protein [Cellulomonas sp. ICMP 17802]|uniref:hypothetical protein n=1 Tax=Cellulomonas sp. ICMP 17802 TaxID=3239199 RepID=UPI00351BC777